MPVTPFHFGPGAAIHALAPKHVSFLAFCAANVFTDLEPLYFMLTDRYPVHRFCHTYLGACVIAAGTVGVFAFARWLAARVPLPNLFQWRELGLLPVALGAAAGTLSHVFLDSIMHLDIRPLAPFSDANPMYQALSVLALHAGCVAAALAGGLVMAARLMARDATRGE